jgi:2-oxoglutarate dehydrogenase E2 component (dihydrolipoamide succinyltransferase)
VPTQEAIMATDIVVPSFGESITEGTVAQWLKKDGEFVSKDEILLEIESEKATQGIPSPAAGALHIGVQEGERVEVGAVLGSIDEEAKTAEPSKKAPPPEKAGKPQATKAETSKETKPAAAAKKAKPAPTKDEAEEEPAEDQPEKEPEPQADDEVEEEAKPKPAEDQDEKEPEPEAKDDAEKPAKEAKSAPAKSEPSQQPAKSEPIATGEPPVATNPCDPL